MNLITVVIQTLGGLGLFILGMKMMTEGLQATAGQKIRRVLEAISYNRFVGCATGAGITALIQSSSATTVMLIGFVGAGMMTLQQAIGVILGANIGTTITGQLIAFKLTSLALPALTVGVILKYFSKKRQHRYIGEIILGFGSLFYGMSVMKQGLAPIKTDPQFLAFFTMVTAESFSGIVLCVLMGALLTVAVQSSSATVGLTMTFASQGLIDFPTAMALVLGENIGTTITAELAIIGSKSISAHRTARAHTLLNVIGVGMMILLFHPFISIVQMITSYLFGAEPVTQIINGETVNVARYIANGHTLFNVFNAIVFLIAMPLLIRVAIFLSPKPSKVKGKNKTDQLLFTLPDFNTTFIDSTIGALTNVHGKVIHMLDFTCLHLKDLSEGKSTYLNKRDQIEQYIDESQKIIIKYLTTIYQGDVNTSQAKEVSELMRIVNNIERVGDAMENISKITEKAERQVSFSPHATQNLLKIATHVSKSLCYVSETLKNRQKDKDFYQVALTNEDITDQLREEIRQQHIERLGKKKCSVESGVLFITLISHYERVGDYCFNIATGVDRII